jgi:hypothetical protein
MPASNKIPDDLKGMISVREKLWCHEDHIQLTPIVELPVKIADAHCAIEIEMNLIVCTLENALNV